MNINFDYFCNLYFLYIWKQKKVSYHLSLKQMDSDVFKVWVLHIEYGFKFIGNIGVPYTQEYVIQKAISRGLKSELKSICFS